MAPRYVPDGIGHGQYGKPEGERHPEKTDAHLGKRGSQDCAPAPAENQPERTDELGAVSRNGLLLLTIPVCCPPSTVHCRVVDTIGARAQALGEPYDGDPLWPPKAAGVSPEKNQSPTPRL